MQEGFPNVCEALTKLAAAADAQRREAPVEDPPAVVDSPTMVVNWIRDRLFGQAADDDDDDGGSGAPWLGIGNMGHVISAVSARVEGHIVGLCRASTSRFIVPLTWALLDARLRVQTGLRDRDPSIRSLVSVFSGRCCNVALSSQLVIGCSVTTALQHESHGCMCDCVWLCCECV